MAELIDRLQVFFDGLVALRSPATTRGHESLAKFFRDGRPLLHRASVERSRSGRIEIDAKQLATTFETLFEPLAKAGARGQLSNVWAIAGLKRNEVRNAAVLASLWTPSLFPQTATRFLGAFLRCLPSSDSLPIGPELEAGYTVRTEECPLGNAGNRVDLSIEGRDFLLVVEVKIDAVEGEQQVSRYNEMLEAKAGLLGKRPSIILLGPRPPRTGSAVHASWADVATAARASARRRKSAELTFADQLLQQFAAHVAAFV